MKTCIISTDTTKFTMASKKMVKASASHAKRGPLQQESDLSSTDASQELAVQVREVAERRKRKVGCTRSYMRM